MMGRRGLWWEGVESDGKEGTVVRRRGQWWEGGSVMGRRGQ